MYCTQDDIQNSGIPEDDLIQLTDDNDLGVVDSDVVDKAISRADEMIDGYLRSRYDVPITPVPGMLNTLAIDLTVYFIYGHRPHIDTPERITAAYRDALSILAKLQTGTMQLPVNTKSGSASSAAFSGSDRLFSRDSMKGLL